MVCMKSNRNIINVITYKMKKLRINLISQNITLLYVTFIMNRFS